MKIIIAGAGVVGLHLTELLSIEAHDIVLIDTNELLLEQIRQRMDIMVIHGDAASPAILMEAQVKQSDLCIAATTSEKTNLLVSMMAKQLGCQKSIARINNPEYLEWKQLEYFESIGISALVSPELLAAQEVNALLKKAAYFDWNEFGNGRILVLGFDIKVDSDLIGKNLKVIATQFYPLPFIVVSILRDGKTIIPNGKTSLKAGDYLHVSTNKKEEKKVKAIFSLPDKKIKRVMVLANTDLCIHTIPLLEKNFQVKLIVKDKELGERCALLCPNTDILLVETFDIKSIKKEGIDKVDAFVSISDNSEANILLGLMAKDAGVYKVIAKINDEQYFTFSRNLGIDSIINKKRLAANEIFKHIRRGNIRSVVSLHGVDAELIEFIVSDKNFISGKSLEEACFPEHSIVTGVIRGDKGLIPRGDFVFQNNDKVITLALYDSIASVEDLCCR